MSPTLLRRAATTRDTRWWWTRWSTTFTSFPAASSTPRSPPSSVGSERSLKLLHKGHISSLFSRQIDPESLNGPEERHSVRAPPSRPPRRNYFTLFWLRASYGGSILGQLLVYGPRKDFMLLPLNPYTLIYKKNKCLYYFCISCSRPPAWTPNLHLDLSVCLFLFCFYVITVPFPVNVVQTELFYSAAV